MRTWKWNLAAAALTLISLASPAKADLLTANVDPGTAVFSFSGLPSGSPFASLNNQSFYVGTLSGTVNGETFPMYCVDLYSDIHPGDTYGVNTHGDVSTLAGHDLIGRLLSLSAPATFFQGAALQLAIWDAEYLNGNPLAVPDPGSGISITTSLGSLSAVFDQANAYLSQAKALPGTGFDNYSYLQVPQGQYGQSMVALIPGITTASAVPEPSSLILATLGLTGAYAAHRRRSPAKPAA